MNELFQRKIQIRANTAIVYDKFVGSRRKSIFSNSTGSSKSTGSNFGGKSAYSGELSDGAVKRMKKAINLFTECTFTRQVYSRRFKKNVSHRLSFITLTIPQDEVVDLKIATKQLLEPLIRHLRQVHNQVNYVWKVELQKRGQLHYHIVSDCYIDLNDLRNKWNQLLTKGGFNSKYVAEKGHNNANSTDIHSVRNVGDLASYLIKYFTKKEQNGKSLNGKLWDCSRALKVAKYYETDLTDDYEYDIYQWQKQGKVTVKSSERFAFIRFKGVKAVSMFCRSVKADYYEHMRLIRTASRDLFTPKNEMTPTQSILPQIVSPPSKILAQQLYLFSN